MKFGVFDHIDANGMPLHEQYEQRLRFTEMYEALGFYAYHLAEHHATPLGVASSSSVFLSAVAQRTKTLKFGPLVYILPLHHPVRLLEEIGMLDQLSNGRFQLGVGPGGQAAEHARFGVARDELRPRFDETFEVLMKGFASDVLEHKGRYYDLAPVPQIIKPIQRPYPPLWYGTSSPDRVGWAAEYGINLISLMPNPRVRELSEAMHTAWAATGKPAEDRPFVGVTRQVIVADSDEAARRIADRVWRRFAESFNWLVNWAGLEAFPFPGEFALAAERGMAFAGSPDPVRTWIAQAEAEGRADYFIGELVFGDMTTEEATRSIELFGREIIPAFA